MRVGVAGWILALGPSGVTRRLEVLVEATALAGMEVYFYAPPGCEIPPGIANSATEIIPVDIPPAPTWKRFRREKKVIPGLVKKHQLDLFHLTHAPAHNLDIPVSLTIHDLRDFTSWSRPYRRLLAGFLWKRAVKHATMLLAISQTTVEELNRFVPTAGDRIKIVPSALPSRFFVPPDKKPTGPLGSGYILSTGRPLPHKNPEALIRAYAMVLQEMPKAPDLVWVGPADDPRSVSLDNLLENLGLETKVRFVGAQPEADLPAIYANSGLTVFPSFYEGQGLGPLEAMAAGSPVLLSNIPAHLEAAGPGANIFSPHDHKELATQILLILKNENECLKLEKKGRTHSQNYLPATMAKTLTTAWIP